MPCVLFITGSAEVREPPIFTKELQDMEVSDGDRVEMSVEVKGQCLYIMHIQLFHFF